jgi:hypothetical protein
LATVGEVRAPQEKQDGSMTVIAAGKPAVRGWIMDLLRAFSHELIAALNQYGETRIHHTASRSQLRRAQRDVIQMRQAIRHANSGASQARKRTEPAAGQ